MVSAFSIDDNTEKDSMILPVASWKSPLKSVFRLGLVMCLCAFGFLLIREY